MQERRRKDPMVELGRWVGPRSFLGKMNTWPIANVEPHLLLLCCCCCKCFFLKHVQWHTLWRTWHCMPPCGIRNVTMYGCVVRFLLFWHTRTQHSQWKNRQREDTAEKPVFQDLKPRPNSKAPVAATKEYHPSGPKSEKHQKLTTER